jgi:hypothetical protein
LNNMNVNGKDDIPYMQWEIKIVWNHQPEYYVVIYILYSCWTSRKYVEHPSSCCCWRHSPNRLGEMYVIKTTLHNYTNLRWQTAQKLLWSNDSNDSVLCGFPPVVIS